MEHIELVVGFGLIEKFLKDIGNFSDVRVERKEDVLNIVLTSEVLKFLKIPVSIKLRLRKAQETPDDPLEFELEAMSIIKKVIRENSGKIYEYDGNVLKILPKRFSSIMGKMRVFDVQMRDDAIVLKMVPDFGRIKTGGDEK